MLSVTYFAHQVHVTFEGVRPINQEDAHGIGFANVLEEKILSNKVAMADTALKSDGELQPSGTADRPEYRQLATVEVWVHFWRVRTFTSHRYKLYISKADGTMFVLEITFTTTVSSHVWIQISVDDEFLNDDMNDVCDTCTFEAEQLDCEGTDEGCDADVVAEVSAAETCS